jgi:hypothetical protein
MTTRMLTSTLVLCCGAFLGAQAQQQPSQEFMVKILESTGTSAAVKLRVLYEVRKIKPQDREPVLVNYIRDDVARWLRYNTAGYQAWRDGKQAAVPETGNDDTERFPLVVGMLAEDHDPVVIPLLVGASHIWAGASEAVADFGEDALDEVIAVVTTNEHNAWAALNILELMVERRTVRKPLSAPARARIAAVIDSKLRGRQELTGALTAIHIAARSGDPNLVARVKQLAQDARELSGDSEEVEQFQQAATDALAEPEPRAHPEIHLLPAGYAGYVTIAFMAPNGEPGDFEGTARLYRIPANGILLTQSPANRGSSPEQQFFIVEPNGDRREVKMSIANFGDMLKNRIHPDVEVFYPTKGFMQGERCDIEYDQYFVGTRAQFLDAGASPDVASKRLEEKFKCL